MSDDRDDPGLGGGGQAETIARASVGAGAKAGAEPETGAGAGGGVETEAGAGPEAGAGGGAEAGGGAVTSGKAGGGIGVARGADARTATSVGTEPGMPLGIEAGCVLIGGRSRRFGRDKLSQPISGGGAVLIERPTSALRAVLRGPIVGVGTPPAELAERIGAGTAGPLAPLAGGAAWRSRARGQAWSQVGDPAGGQVGSGLFDGLIADEPAGVGPASGIAAALAALGRPVMVLAGDLVGIEADTVRAVCLAAMRAPAAWACLAVTDRVEPCIGVYRPAALEALRTAARGGHPLRSAIAEADRVLVPIAAAAAVNINRPEDLSAWAASAAEPVESPPPGAGPPSRDGRARPEVGR